jgi:hypothetical protein
MATNFLNYLVACIIFVVDCAILDIESKCQCVHRVKEENKKRGEDAGVTLHTQQNV